MYLSEQELQELQKLPTFHSKAKDCEIFPDKKSWSHLTERYSYHYCKTHNVKLGHQEETGASNSGWELHWYGGTPSITNLATYQRFQTRVPRMTKQEYDKARYLRIKAKRALKAS